MKRLFIASVLLIVVFNISGQGTLVSPSVTRITNPSADINNNSKYDIVWDWEGSVAVDSFIIYRYSGWNSLDNKPSYSYVASVDGKKRKYSFFPVDELNKVVYYAVEAKKGNVKSVSNISRVPDVSAPSNILLELKFDSCENKLTLSWNKFFGWTAPSKNTFNIEYSKNNGKSIIMKFKGNANYDSTSIVLNDSSFGLYKDTLYNFRVIAIGTSGYKCVSNAAAITPKMLQIPSYINADGSKVDGDNQIELSFTIDPINELEKLVLYKSTQESDGYTEYDTVAVDGSSVVYVDKNVDSLSTRQYYYKATLLNNCNLPMKLQSNVVSNICLKFNTEKNDKNINLLNWGSYAKFQGTLKEYVVYRIKMNDSSQIASTTSNYKADDLSSLDKEPMEEICYYVEAIEKDNPHDINGHAWSNRICMTVKASIDMPKYLVLGSGCKSKAETPFKYPANAASPKNFEMIIFDRWGTQVFETKKSSEGWDGTYNGKVAQPGAYMYYIKYSGADNQSIEDRSTFTVLCQ